LDEILAITWDLQFNLDEVEADFAVDCSASGAADFPQRAAQRYAFNLSTIETIELDHNQGEYRFTVAIIAMSAHCRQVALA
jgi:hypothetical protein